MDETLSTDERSTLRAGAIGALRAMLAAQEARLPLRRVSMATSSGRHLPSVIRSIVPWTNFAAPGNGCTSQTTIARPSCRQAPRGKRPGESTSTNHLVATIKRVLRRIDPETPSQSVAAELRPFLMHCVSAGSGR